MTVQHEAPESEGAARAAQLAAMSLTVIEALARLRAERLTDRAADDERAASAARAQHLADHAHARVVWARAHDDTWLRAADTDALGRAWAAATAWADSDTDARAAAELLERRLHELHPQAMAAYHSARADGLDPGEAMRQAAPLFQHLPAIGTGPSTAVGAESATAPDPRHARDVAADGFPRRTEQGGLDDGTRRTGSAHLITTAPARPRARFSRTS